MKIEKKDLKNALIATAAIEGLRRLFAKSKKELNYEYSLAEVDESLLERFDKTMYQLATGSDEDQGLHQKFIIFIGASFNPSSIVEQAAKCEDVDALRIKIIARGWNKSKNVSFGEKILEKLFKIREEMEPSEEEFEEERRKLKEAKEEYEKFCVERKERKKQMGAERDQKRKEKREKRDQKRRGRRNR